MHSPRSVLLLCVVFDCTCKSTKLCIVQLLSIELIKRIRIQFQPIRILVEHEVKYNLKISAKYSLQSNVYVTQ